MNSSRAANTQEYTCDLNSHSLEWGYSSEDENGEKLVNWSLVGHKHLVYDAKQGGTFESGRWGTITSPDLCFVTRRPGSAFESKSHNFKKVSEKST